MKHELLWERRRRSLGHLYSLDMARIIFNYSQQGRGEALQCVTKYTHLQLGVIFDTWQLPSKNCIEKRVKKTLIWLFLTFFLAKCLNVQFLLAVCIILFCMPRLLRSFDHHP